MNEVQLSTWAVDRFGDAAVDLFLRVPTAIHRAHKLALDAHMASEIRTNDVYGSALSVLQHQLLVELTNYLPGVDARRPKAMRSRFSLVVINETNVVLYPWRYATDNRASRRDAKMRPPVSDLRRGLLTLTPHPYDWRGQLSFDDIDVDEDEFAAVRAEEDAMLEQLMRRGRVVTIGYASNPAGLFDLGWGDCELVDDTGHVVWSHWETLPLSGPEVGYGRLRAQHRPDGSTGLVRFDTGSSVDDDFGLTLRSPLAGAPTSEPGPARPETGSDDDTK